MFRCFTWILAIVTGATLSNAESLKDKVKRQLVDPPSLEWLEYEAVGYDHNPPHKAVATVHQFARWNSPNSYYFQTLQSGSQPDHVDLETANLFGRLGEINWQRKQNTMMIVDCRLNSPDLPKLTGMEWETVTLNNLVF